MGPLFWNPVVDQVLKEVSSVSRFIAFADDFLLLQAARLRSTFEIRMNKALRAFSDACVKRNPRVATNKAEAVLFGKASSLGRQHIFRVVSEKVKIKVST